jgi:hypothetical protein
VGSGGNRRAPRDRARKRRRGADRTGQITALGKEQAGPRRNTGQNWFRNDDRPPTKRPFCVAFTLWPWPAGCRL